MLKHSFDYFPFIGRLVLRMRTESHVIFSCGVSKHINEKLRLVSRSSGSATEFARDVEHRGSATIRPHDP